MFYIDRKEGMENQTVIQYPVTSVDITQKVPLYLMPSIRYGKDESGSAERQSYGFDFFKKSNRVGGTGIYSEEEKELYLKELSDKTIVNRFF